MTSLTASLFLTFAAAFTVQAGEPADLVKRFYDRQADLFSPSDIEAYTAGSLREFMGELAEFAKAHPDVPCVDFDPLLDAQDFDEDEINRTLKLDEQEMGDGATVTASFAVFGETRSVAWQLQKINSAWKVTDMASRESGWRFSDMVCEAE